MSTDNFFHMDVPVTPAGRKKAEDEFREALDRPSAIERAAQGMSAEGDLFIPEFDPEAPVGISERAKALPGQILGGVMAGPYDFGQALEAGQWFQEKAVEPQAAASLVAEVPSLLGLAGVPGFTDEFAWNPEQFPTQPGWGEEYYENIPQGTRIATEVGVDPLNLAPGLGFVPMSAVTEAASVATRAGTKVAGALSDAPILSLLKSQVAEAAGFPDIPLPRDLAKATPRYREHVLTFDSPLDMVLYSLGKTTKKSKRDADYLAWAMEVTGKSEAEVRAAGREVKKRIKALAADQPGDGPIHVWDIGAEEAVPAVGAAPVDDSVRFIGQRDIRLTVHDIDPAIPESRSLKIERLGPEGNVVDELFVFMDQEGTTVNLDIVRRPLSDEFGEEISGLVTRPTDFISTPGEIRDVLRTVKNLFPDAENVSGLRSTEGRRATTQTLKLPSQVSPTAAAAAAPTPPAGRVAAEGAERFVTSEKVAQGQRLRVIDDTDPSLLTVETPQGNQMKIGRGAVRGVVPEGAAPTPSPAAARFAVGSDPGRGAWVYHKTGRESLQAIVDEGFAQGDFIEGLTSVGKVEFPGEATLRTRLGNLPQGQVGEYGPGVKWHLPDFETAGKSVDPNAFEIKVGANNELIDVKGKGRWIPLTEYVSPQAAAPTPPVAPVAAEAAPTSTTAARAAGTRAKAARAATATGPTGEPLPPPPAGRGAQPPPTAPDVPSQAAPESDLLAALRRREPPNGPQTPPPGRGTGDEPPLQFNDDGSIDLIPPVENNIINLQPIQVGLTSGEKIRDLAARTIGKIFEATPLSEYATPAMRERFRVRQNIASLATNLGERTRARFARQIDGRVIFELDDKGRIPSLTGVDPTVPGAPTIPDVAARLPRYRDALSPEQMRALRDLESDLRPWRAMLDELGFDIPRRMDLMDDLVYAEPGFYIPRGRTALEGADEPIRIGGRGRRGKPGFEKRATFASMSEGISQGYEYAPIHEVVQGYARDAGSKALDKHIANFFISVREEGVLIGITPKIRLLKQNPDLVLAKQDLDKNLNRLKSLLGRMTERQQKIIDDFIFNDEFDDIDALFDALSSVQAAGGPSVGANIREVQALIRATKADINKIRPKWKAALKQAQATGRGEGAIDLTALNNRTFPVAVADAANAVLAAEKREPRAILREIAVLNNLYRGFNATGDNSALGVQGWLSLASDPQAYASAMKTNIRAWGKGGDQVLGQFLMTFDDAAVKTGRMNSIGWGQETLRLGGQDTEYLIGGQTSSFLNRIPGIRQANRAFGYFGDALRLQAADDELERLIRTTGRSIEDLRSSGEVRKIAEAVNGTTGYSPGKTFGDIGDLVFFAPRFLQARMETVARGLMSLRPGATVEQRFARRSLLKLIGYGTLITFAANMLLGNETEVKPWKNGRYNSNFMRIRFGDRDISVFGSWELFPRAIISTVQGHPEQIVRGLGSGVVSSTWDLFWNKDFMGKAVYDSPQDFAEWIIGHVTPFAADELLPTTKNLAKGVTGDARSLVAGITSAITETLGIKSSPLSGSEATAMAREAQAQQMGNTLASYRTNELGELIDDRPAWQKFGGIQIGDTSPSPIYDQLSSWDKEKVNKTPAVAKAKEEWEKQQRERQSQYRAYKDEDDKLVATFKELINQIAGPSREARTIITLHQRDLARERESLRDRSSEALQWLEEKDPAKGIENEAFTEYAELIFDDILTDPVTGAYDFEERDKRMAVLRNTWTGEVIDKIEDFIHRNDPPLMKKLRADRETLRPYWQIEDDLVATLSRTEQQYWKQYRAADSGLRYIIQSQGDLRPLEEELAKRRQAYRYQNPDADVALDKWGYAGKPMTQPVQRKAMEQFRGVMEQLPPLRQRTPAPVQSPMRGAPVLPSRGQSRSIQEMRDAFQRSTPAAR